jgi:hypothetical protein
LTLKPVHFPLQLRDANELHALFFLEELDPRGIPHDIVADDVDVRTLIVDLLLSALQATSLDTAPLFRCLSLGGAAICHVRHHSKMRAQPEPSLPMESARRRP